MKKGTLKRLTRQQQAELKSLAVLRDDAIDTSDAPELPDWSGARRGQFYRPIKQQLTLRRDADVVTWFKRHTTPDEGYQTRINRALREYVQEKVSRAGALGPESGEACCRPLRDCSEHAALFRWQARRLPDRNRRKCGPRV
jgi:uncharacterized protein (DUF4415 family)